MLATGASIHNRYTVERLLARGGMATVYIVRHITLDTQYALKVLDIQTSDVRARLLQEGRIQASLKHPNIVAVTDSIEIDNHPALVMEYVEGPTLAAVMEEGIDRELGELWFRQIVSAVSYAHARGLVHRDLKPENVLMAPMIGGYLPKVADFGIAKVVQDYLTGDNPSNGPRTKTGIGMGTPAYMPPEQVQSAGDVDHRADVFALGCILYELMCGQRAFPGDNLLSILNAIADGDYTPPWQHREDLDERIVAAIDGALEPNPDLRIQSCDALLQVLSGQLQREPKTPAPASARPHSRRPLTTQPLPMHSDDPEPSGSMRLIIGGVVALLFGTAVLLAVLLVGGVTGAALWMQPGSATPKNGLPDSAAPAMPTLGGDTDEPIVIREPAVAGAAGSNAFDVTVHSWRELPMEQAAPLTLEPEQAGHAVYLVNVSLTRNNTSHDINTFPWMLVGPNGQEYRANFQCHLMMDTSLNPMETYEAGDTASGEVCFVAPPGLRGARVRFSALFGGGGSLFFPLE